ncbi:hypothetical protein AKJ09_00634 [Labilithrix luteola]|uniref:DUF2267 domain-containing protein n=1 Tax=Labilithrix luteola TaxID=1391654 RepID=A0A0K1PKB4_9BACT|nr:DUF2267 domain-containing protein [Labilithrix luteola]AKU93970.1 hypothetical protein AKJ09_00634 [Labilithrix luteola]
MQFERSQVDPETTNRVRRTVADSARLPSALTVESALGAVMCALTQRLTAGGAFDVLEAVPQAIAPMFEVCVLHREGKPVVKADRAEFVDAVGEHLGVTPAHAEVICSAVFTAVRSELSANAVAGVAAQLPHGLKELWIGPPVSAPDLDVDVPPEETKRAIERDLARRGHLPPNVHPSKAFASVLGLFTKRLSGGEARHVLIGLPLVVRPLVESSTTHRQENASVFGREELFTEVGRHLGTDRAATEHIVLEVLRAAKRALPQQTIADVEAQLPPDLRDLWRSALPPHEG